jgi:Mn2+/Fe2+ NRAMP family transporter
VESSRIVFSFAIVGTTIAPWQLFFQQSCVADKRLRFKDLNWSRLDTAIGATFTVIVMLALVTYRVFTMATSH